MMVRLPSQKRDKGFTLIELLVSIALMLILIGIITFIFIQARRTYTQTIERVENFQDIRHFIDLLETNMGSFIKSEEPDRSLQIIGAEYAPVSGGGNVRADELIFQSEDKVEVDGDYRYEPVMVRYFLANQDKKYPSLKREIWPVGSPDDKKTQTLVRKVREFAVDWFAETGVGGYYPPDAETADASRFFAQGEGKVSDDTLTAETTASGDPIGDVGPFAELQPNDEVYVRGWKKLPTGEKKEIIPGRWYSIKRVASDSAPADSVLLFNHVEDLETTGGQSKVEYKVFTYPPSLRLTIRMLPEVAADSVTKVIEIPK